MQNMFKVNTEVTRTTSMMSSDVFIVNFEHILHHLHHLNFEQVDVCCVVCVLIQSERMIENQLQKIYV